MTSSFPGFFADLACPDLELALDFDVAGLPAGFLGLMR
jgi:hypothetical protein